MKSVTKKYTEEKKKEFKKESDYYYSDTWEWEKASYAQDSEHEKYKEDLRERIAGGF